MAEDLLLPGGEWRLWPQFALRGPGFPAAGVLALAPPGLAEEADKFDDGAALSGPEWTEFTGRFATAAAESTRALQGFAASPAFRTAVAWQNPAVLGRGVGLFLGWDVAAEGRTSKRREREELVAHYWQRFCVKNDTIGFFGPVGWGRWDPARKGLAVDPGTGLVCATEVFFASWAIDALARTVDADPAVRPWVPPRRVPFVRPDGEFVRVPGRPPQEATARERELLRLCDGTRDLAALTAAVSAPAAEVRATLETMVTRRWLVWRLEVPLDAHPERYLRTALARIGDEPARDRALTMLGSLERARDRVAAAGLDADELSAAMTALETEFAALTQVAAQRAKSARTAPGRALVYADCRRSATADVGTAVLDELAPLSLCLTAARWMTGQFAEAADARLHQAYERIRARQGSADLGSLWLECLPAPYGESVADITGIQAELRRRWAGVLDLPGDARRVHRTSAELAERVRTAFPRGEKSWSLSRYASPDLLVVADDADAVERGEFDLVLGELHVAMNTVGHSLFVRQHPDPARLHAENARDYPGPRLIPMLPKAAPPRISARGQHALVRPEDYHVALVDYTGDPHRPRTVAGADVAVEDRDGRLVAVVPDGTEFDALDGFCSALTNRVIDRFALVPDGPHTPRITIDRLIVARETWRRPAADLEFATDTDEARRFVRARQWRNELELPRFVFVVSPTEPRPFYVDFDSPVYVNILAKAVRRLARKDPSGRLTITEMLPTPDRTWLTDDQGATYTAELRLIVVDGAR
ncbi:lantibiotic dehydratase [Amycolatopsis sp. NBRC 101858]|uniref:lantibiotic dehydratase n=1 Tax=Amycolatopsis sp. NBRC 101858 TaxID=3032200 RepID=UPI0024A41CA0|nr:lantibiotic dehydratase [Amycolatopsis sp. NBRC 101858]GLY38122.1 lantibiotic dehydratase [Amycolatopsis sp. NBRC 101858]